MKNKALYLFALLSISISISQNSYAHQFKNIEHPEISSKDQISSIYTSDKWQFSIDFFGHEPKINIDDVSTELGPIEMYTFMHSITDTELYMVAVSKYPESENFETGDPYTVIDGAQEGAMNNIEVSKYDYEEQYTVNGYPAKKFSGNNGNFYVNYRLILVDRTLYQIAILKQGEYVSSENKKRFFDSFELHKNEEIKPSSGKTISESGKFAIDFFGNTPVVSSDVVSTAVGDLNIYMFMWEKSSSEAYMVSYNDYPSELIEGSDANTLLEGGKNGALSNLEIKEVDFEQEISINGHSGLTFTGNNGNLYAMWQIFLVDNRMYQVAILKEGEYANIDEANKFFKSFILLE